ncbi:MAG: hypothetical protein J5802_06155 [Butyrivibrio sp.]|nr:hypothetical protein [Butyrivibrio sp.]
METKRNILTAALMTTIALSLAACGSNEKEIEETIETSVDDYETPDAESPASGASHESSLDADTGTSESKTSGKIDMNHLYSLPDTIITCKGKNISLFGDLNDCTEELGAPTKDSSDESSYFYKYDNFYVEAVKKDDKTPIVTLAITGENAKTGRGINFYNTQDDIKRIYGEPTEANDTELSHVMTYTYDGYALTFVFEKETNKMTLIMLDNFTVG